MNSNAQIEPATFHFPDPPKRSIDKGAQLTHLKRHFPKGFTRLQPRTAGFSYNCESDQSKILGEILEPRRLNRQICEELLKGPLGATQDDKPPSEHRKHSLMKVFSSRSKRESAREDKKMPVATQRTSDGRKYGQILSGQSYDNSRNASTYQVNERRTLLPLASEGQLNHATDSCNLVGNVESGIHRFNGTKEPVRKRSARMSIGVKRLKIDCHLTRPMNFPIPPLKASENYISRTDQ